MPGPESRFVSVSEIKLPGKYVFATHPGLKQYSEPSLPDFTQAFDNVMGLRPRWEQEIHRYLSARSRQDTRELLWSLSWEKEEGIYQKHLSIWRGHNGVIVKGATDYYKYFETVRGGVGVDLPFVSLEDCGNPEIIRGRPEIPRDRFKNGRIELELEGATKLDARGPYWRGRLNLKGTHPGDLITYLVDFFNQETQKLTIPVWKDLS